ncbi:type III secretion system export apparatus subunit SctU [Nitratidesulfovibrio vulgaris]|jgi:type III secretion protein U|uniref:Type III secretion protein, YscU/HrpY family n=1 Tax=Nitratidesulfovibrio vulgaris (strain DP4) TaxID=391774 RepID=A0A0H3ABM7_NITV4|nr:type III secretion system export apparatus subunit SctU [Nitratidesulfovibrio vulgaris]ABM30022.1 type III secretion protein, YscU/HrpY family [Nitratidesulfovibrio vulgaris DP4]
MSDKTEQPTPKRLREAREKGDICKSQDIGSAVTVLAVAGYFAFAGESIFASLMEVTELSMRHMAMPFDEALPLLGTAVVHAAVGIVLPVVGLAMMAAFLGTLAQTGVLFAFKGAMPKLENISPGKWFKKVFSMRNAVELLKNCIKVGVLGWAVWKVMSDHMRGLFAIPDGDIGLLLKVLGTAARDMVLMAAVVFCVIAALDYLYQRWQYNKQHMMTKDEVKREYKEMEGDPHIKGKRKQLHQEMLAQNTLSNVRKAKVIVTNPTHFAVALDYEKDRTPLPVILAKGEGLMARRMVEIAREEGIPVMQNVPLARSLFAEGTENAYIPKELIGPVAEVLRWVQSLQER